MAKEVEPASETSANTRSKLRSCSIKTALEKDPEEEHVVGNMLITVISQSSGSEVDEDTSDKSDSDRSSERENLPNRKSTLKNKNKNNVMRNSSKKNSSPKKSNCSEGEAHLSALVSCMKRQLRVVLPRLNINSDDLHVHLKRLSNESEETRSPGQTDDTSKVGNSHFVNRKRKYIDWTPTPEKHPVDTVSKL